MLIYISIHAFYYCYFREILMTATEKIRTPQMDVLVKQGMADEAADIAKILTRLTLMDVRDCITHIFSFAI